MQGMNNIVMIVLMITIFYFFMIRPQMKRQKELKKFRENLAQGDKVVTTGGIHGKILEVTDTTVLISSDGTKFRVEKASISHTTDDQLKA